MSTTLEKTPENENGSSKMMTRKQSINSIEIITYEIGDYIHALSYNMGIVHTYTN